MLRFQIHKLQAQIHKFQVQIHNYELKSTNHKFKFEDWSHNHLVRKRTLTHLVKMIKWLWDRVLLLSLKTSDIASALSKEFLDI